MLEISWIMFCGILLAAAYNTRSSELERSYNIGNPSLETDNVDNIKFLDKVKKIIDKLKSVFVRKNVKRLSLPNEKLEKFTDFINDLIVKLNKYEDTELEHFVSVFNDEIRKYHYRGCKFYELIENYSLKKYLSNILNNAENLPGAVIKNNLKVLANKINKGLLNDNVENLIEIINTVYRQESVKKFHNFLVAIDTYRLNKKSNLHLVKIIREGLRSIIFDHYSKLNIIDKIMLRHQVNEFWESFSNSNLCSSSEVTEKVTSKVNNFNIEQQIKDQSLYLFNTIKSQKLGSRRPLTQRRVRNLYTHEKLETLKHRRSTNKRQNLLFTYSTNDFRRLDGEYRIIPENFLRDDLPDIYDNQYLRKDIIFYSGATTNAGSALTTHNISQMVLAHNFKTRQNKYQIKNQINNTTIKTKTTNKPLSERKTVITSEVTEKHIIIDNFNTSQTRYQFKTRLSRWKNRYLMDLKSFNYNLNKPFKNISNNLSNEGSVYNLQTVREKNKDTTTIEKNSTFSIQNKIESPIFRSITNITINSDNETGIKPNINEPFNTMVSQNTVGAIISQHASNAIDFKKEIAKSHTENFRVEQLYKQEEKVIENIQEPSLKTDNDFRSFIEDYENDFRGIKINKEKVEYTIKTDTVSITKLSTAARTTSINKTSIVSLPTYLFTRSQTHSLSNTSFTKEDPGYIPAVFKGNLIKHLLETTTTPPTTRDSKVLGRYFNVDGVVKDSMEEVINELDQIDKMQQENYDEKEETDDSDDDKEEEDGKNT